MSQEYTEDKEVTLRKLSSGRPLLEVLLLLVALFAIYLMVALLSFNPSDPSWSQTAWHEPIHNLGGTPGTWVADTLFFIFGVMAYIIPVIIIGGCWFIWRQRERDSEEFIDYFAVSLRLIGVLAMVLTSCGLAAINADDIWYFASGGVLGSLLSTAMVPLLNSSSGTIALLCVWAAGLTLFTGWSWVSIAEKLGSAVPTVLTFARTRTRRDKTWQDEDEYEEEHHEDEPQHVSTEKRESRRARILCGAPARKKRLSQKFANPNGRKTDTALFSDKRIDDPEDDVLFSARGVEADTNDVLFSGHSAVELIAAAAAVTTANQSWIVPVAPMPAVSTPAPVVDAAPTSPAIAWAPITVTPEPAIPRTPEHYSSPHPASVQQQVQHETHQRWAEPVAPEAQPFTEPRPAPEFVEEVKYVRSPMYHFEEVEEKRAREREQLAAWYQPVDEPNPDHYNYTQNKPAPPKPVQPSTPTPAPISAPFTAPEMPVPNATQTASGVQQAAKAAVGAAAFSPVFSIADDAPRPQVKEGMGSQLPRPNRVGISTRHELASYGIKLPSQRMAEEKARLAASQQSDDDYGDENDALLQHDLARQFSAQQQQRYREQPQQNNDPFSLDDFDFQSLLKDLADDTPSEPLFTPSFEPVSHPVQNSQPVAQPAQHQPVAAAPKESLIHPFLYAQR